jgi:hypothetical protein
MLLSENKFQVVLIKLLLYILPFHYMIFVILLGDFGLVKYWKDIVIILLFIIPFFNLKNFVNVKIDLVIFYISLFLIVVGYYVLISDIITIALYHSRLYLLPLICFLIFRSINIKLDTFSIILKNLFYIAVALSIFGIFQAYILRPEFLVKIGYPLLQNGLLSHVFFLSGIEGIQRVTSTFVYPNTFAFYLGMIIIIVGSNKELVFGNNKKGYFIGTIILHLALLLTFSRSVMLGLVIIYFFKNFKSFRKIPKFLLLLFFFFPISLLIIYLLLGNYGIFKKIFDYISRTLTFEDTSAVGHVDSLNNSIRIFQENLFGTGLGYNGPKALLNFYSPYLTESSYFLMQFEVGIIGFVVYFLIYFGILARAIRKYKTTSLYYLRDLYRSSYLLIILTLIIYLFLPYVQDIETLIYLFSLLGLTLNENRKLDVFINEKVV